MGLVAMASAGLYWPGQYVVSIRSDLWGLLRRHNVVCLQHDGPVGEHSLRALFLLFVPCNSCMRVSLSPEGYGVQGFDAAQVSDS